MSSRDRDKPSRRTAPTAAAEPADESFLGRWSRRKEETRRLGDDRDAPARDDPGPLRSQASKAPLANDERPETEPPTIDPASLPDIDQMDAGSDFSVFMQAGVPPTLKTKALRKLWRVKPELANLDGLVDYGEDITGSFKVVDHLKTAYEVGKGFLRDDHEGEADDDPPPEPDNSALAKRDDESIEINQKEDESTSDSTTLSDRREPVRNPKG